MSNGKIREAEIELMLKDVPDSEYERWRVVLVGIDELKQGQKEMREMCERRAITCPGLHLADPDVPIAAKDDSDDRRTWVMWSTGITMIERIGIPVVLVILTIGLTKLFG